MSKILLRPQSANPKNGISLLDLSASKMVNSRLIESTVERKRAEEEANILENRIKLLKLEEKKAQKQIEEAKKKTQQIFEAKTRNQNKSMLAEQVH